MPRAVRVPASSVTGKVKYSDGGVYQGPVAGINSSPPLGGSASTKKKRKGKGPLSKGEFAALKKARLIR